MPVALNSGMFWGRRRFLKYPGVITLEALPPMPLALGRAAFMEELERRIETATDRLCEEAAQVPQRSPHPLAPLAPSSVETCCGPPSPAGTGPGQRRGARHRGRSRRDLTSGT